MLFCVFIRDVLPFPLELPDAIAKASSHKELESISHMGIGLLTQLVSLCMILFSHYVQKKRENYTDELTLYFKRLPTMFCYHNN